MEWLRAHWYAGALTVCAALIVLGTFVVQSRTPLSQTSSTITWGAGTPLSAYQIGTQPTPQQVAQEIIQNQNPSSLSLPPLSTSSPVVFGENPNSFDYASLIAQLSGGFTASTSVSRQTSSASASAIISEAYQFIPSGLVATTAPPTKPMTAEQKTYYEYGNEIGGEIQSFEELHMNETQVLTDQAQDRTNPAKAAALTSLGQSIASVGTFLQQMQDVPPQAKALHDALAQSYLDIGGKLQLVAQAQSDGDFVKAIENYDAAANTFVHNYAALAEFFTEQGVSFTSEDPGRVFSFNQGGGL